MALIKERVMEFNLKHRNDQPVSSMKYFAETVIAKTLLPKLVVNHIKKCFSKQGMQQLKTKRRSKQHQDKVQSTQKVSALVQNDVSGDDMEEVSEVHDCLENEHVDLLNETDENVDGCLEDEDENEAVIHDLENNNADESGPVNCEMVSKESENEEEHVPTVNEIKEDL